ncbi:M23 family metallopeptidase [Kitasatospora purpeofusca]|uniref:M23 family metallopeptidase n=1 Tax=Kitasatospora purpeofusca TaxID=67352 RepID=UPI0033EF62A2
MSILLKYHGPVFGAGTLCILVNALVGTGGVGVLWLTGVALLAVGGLLRWSQVRSQRPRGEREPHPVAVPVEGRWSALNGPADKVPSHTHSHAQTYAIDLVLAPAEGEPQGPPFRLFAPFGHRAERYPSFGRPVLAPADGTVVAVETRMRDHWSRASLPAFGYLYLEGFVRGLGRPRHLWGNFVLLDLGDGVVAGFAHLRRGSPCVAVGDRVRAGQRLGECGNSGNSSEPHLHFQLMDGPDPELARGVPFSWGYRDDTGAEHSGVPQDSSTFTALPALPARPL